MCNKNDTNTISINSVGYPIVEIDCDELDVKQSEKGTSEAFVRGVLRYFADKGFKIGGFDATTTSDVFKGAGVSSSASFEVLVAEILNFYYNDGKVTAMEKAKASQFAENVFFGKPCGLLDQSAIALGGISFIDFKNPEKPVVENMEWAFDDCDIVLINAGGDHSGLTGEYAAIRQEMEQVAKLFNKPNLRSLKKSTFMGELPFIKDKVSGRAILRAMHYFNENERVDKCRKAVSGNKYKAFCKCINESGMSSYLMLQNMYPQGDTEQGIPLCVNLAKNAKGVDAVRVHGGGFAGTTISYVQKTYTKDYVQYMSKIFGKENIFVVNVRNVGATVIEL